MQKALIFLTCGATLTLLGCAGRETKSEYRESVLSDLPFVYKMTVQQGNIVTEEMIDRLEPGMTRSQVRYLLGTPVLVDIFHQDRWYYTYTIRRGHGEMEKRPLVVFFDGDQMVRVEGFLRPEPQRAASREPRQMLITVPDWDGDTGLLSKTLRTVGLKDSE
jgi:outer membrane protein assembly factor BamE